MDHEGWRWRVRETERTDEKEERENWGRNEEWAKDKARNEKEKRRGNVKGKIRKRK